MKHSHGATLLLLCVLSFISGNMVQYAMMIGKVTGNFPLKFNKYGCYCGLRGSKQPKDEIDWCCHAHDCCYRRLEKLGCKPFTEDYSFQEDSLYCGGKKMCQRETCECDKACALCFQENACNYNKAYMNYPKNKCKGDSPPCL